MHTGIYYQKSSEISISPLRYRAGGEGAAQESVSSKADSRVAPGAVPAEREQFFGQV